MPFKLKQKQNGLNAEVLTFFFSGKHSADERQKVPKKDQQQR